MSSRETSWDSPNATSSRALEAGPWPSGGPESGTTFPSGRDRAPASLSARRAREVGSLTSGTYGPHSITSFASDVLASSLANRLLRRAELNGSDLFDVTSKERATSSGQSIPALRASARRTSANGSTGWPTPTVTDARGSRNRTCRRSSDGKHNDGVTLTDAVAMHGLPVASWREPTVPGVFVHPDLSRWLMGYPATWSSCAAMATLSSSTKPPSSSRQGSTSLRAFLLI